MKKLAFLALVLFTYYWASMYRSLPLMIVCVSELFLLLVLLILPRVFRGGVSAHFQKKSESTEQNTETVCRLTVRNDGRLPVSRVRARLRVRYARETGGRDVKKTVCGAGDRGESLLEFQLRSVHCGLVQVKLDRLRVYDYLALFSSSKRMQEEMCVAVFPDGQALRISLAASSAAEDRPQEVQTVSRPGDAYNDIRQIREYRIGDSNRHIHWNQSAKTDQMWIKEYEKETDVQADVLLDAAGLSGAAEWSAYYRLLSALALGLLKDAAVVRVHWCSGEGNDEICMDVSDAEQCRDMLLKLYRTEQVRSAAPETQQMRSGRVFRVTAGLSVFAGGVSLHTFSAEGLEQELQEISITI